MITKVNSEERCFYVFRDRYGTVFSAGAVCTDLFLESAEQMDRSGACGRRSMPGAAARRRRNPILSGGVFLPLVLLFPLFCFRMMGAGDIKLMAVMGGILGSCGILKGMFCAFILGAVLSLAFLISCGNLQERFSYFFHYLKVCKEKHCPVPYRRQGAQAENLHFTVPILLGIMLYAGGFC